jgi:hypothetical protein
MFLLCLKPMPSVVAECQASDEMKGSSTQRGWRTHIYVRTSLRKYARSIVAFELTLDTRPTKVWTCRWEWWSYVVTGIIVVQARLNVFIKIVYIWLSNVFTWEWPFRSMRYVLRKARRKSIRCTRVLGTCDGWNSHWSEIAPTWGPTQHGYNVLLKRWNAA